jgi:exodeoxyribonuclease-5
MSIEHWVAEFKRSSGMDITAQTYADIQKALTEYRSVVQYHQNNIERLADLAKQYEPKAYKGISRFKLTAGQDQALTKLQSWLRQQDSFFLLKGFAGTGKSYVVSEFAKTLDQRTTLYTAPTNKATKVLKSLLPKHVCKTIYSALGLRMVEREDERVLMPSDEKVDLSRYGVIVVDESSMLSTELLQYIFRAAKQYGIKFLFVADEAQLPPIGEDISPVFKLDCPYSELTEVVRHDNQILELATHIRHHVFANKRISPIVFAPNVQRCVWRFSPSKFYDRLESSAYSGFAGMKCIAWRNSKVDELNAVIRNQLYSDADLASSRWLVGDRIVFTEPVYSEDGKTFLATTDDEGAVTKVSVGTDPETKLATYFLSIKLDFGTTIRVRCIHEDSESEFSDKLSELAHTARQPGNGRVWGVFWKLKNRYTSIRHSYAITAHRAQGSTFNTVFIDMGDILSNSDRSTALRCAYVAATRPSHKLYMTGFPV